VSRDFKSVANVYMCIYVVADVYMCIYVYTDIYIQIYIYMYIHIHIYICIYVCIYTYVCVYRYMYIYIYVCEYITGSREGFRHLRCVYTRCDTDLMRNENSRVTLLFLISYTRCDIRLD